jgi:hypothetical protein
MKTSDYTILVAAIILGAFILLSVCVGGFFLTTNTVLHGLLSGNASAATRTATPSTCVSTEELRAPFSRGVNGVTSQQSYSGHVRITVSGTGQAAGSAYSDAFYLYTDDNGSPISPASPDDFVLTINGQPASYLIPGGDIPTYSLDHVYPFEIAAPEGKLSFGVNDGYSTDNTGAFSISICQQ